MSSLRVETDMRGSRGGEVDRGVRLTPENHKNIGFISNTGPDPPGIFLQFWEGALGPFRLGKLAR